MDFLSKSLVRFLLGVSIFTRVYGINREGIALIAFKTAIVEDPEGVLNGWNASDDSPCSWPGISCAPNENGKGENRVVSISLPKKHLAGILPSILGSLIFLRRINLRHNNFNGTLPKEIFSEAKGLESVNFNGNFLSGVLPEEIGNLKELQVLDLSLNYFQGNIPSSIMNCTKLKKLIMNNNNFSGPIPKGMGNKLTDLQQLDLSMNHLEGSIPPDLGNLSHLEGALKLSNNFLTGQVPSSLGNLPEKVSLDLTYNNLTGPIPQNGALGNQGPTAFVGNQELCGYPLRKTCPTKKQPYLPGLSPPHPSPALKTVTKSKSLSKGAIIAIIVGDVGGIAILSLALLYCYWKALSCKDKDASGRAGGEESSSGRGGNKVCICSRRKKEDSEAGSENIEQLDLVVLDGQVGFDLDELLRASAFVLGKSGVGIVYKVVLEDGLTLAVRRLGEGGNDRQKEFQAEVDAVGRIRHPNVVTLRAYYWSADEKLLVYDYIPNGSLAAALHGRASVSSPLLWAARLKIAKGIARGLAHIHECCPKKHIHGDIKPTNILLGLNMEPYIADLALGRIASIAGAIPSTALLGQGILMSPGSSYQAPEASKTLKPTQKWDVYSFGVILLELLSGKSAVVQVGSSELDLVRWVQLSIEEKQPLQEVLDPVLIEELHREEEILGVLKIALACVQGSPDRRPSMKHVAELLDKLLMTYHNTIEGKPSGDAEP